MAMVAVKNHKNAIMDPYSHYQYEVTIEQVLKSPTVCWPLGILDCCPQTDGAAAVIICKPEVADKYTDKPIYVSGFGSATDYCYYNEKLNWVGFESTVKAATQAYEMAGIGPGDIDLAEIHDCFSITEIINYEDLGFCEKGKGGEFIEKGYSEITGTLPCNPSGGLMSKGHPLGATGLAQIAEVYWHLREEAGDRQVEIKKGYGLNHNVGGFGIGTSAVTILSNRKE
jgi:acetyl-CoA C-acetyltransferase